MESHPRIEKDNNSAWSKLIVAFGSATSVFLGDTIVYPIDTMNTWVKLNTHTSQPKIIKEHLNRLGLKHLYAGFSTQFGCIFLPGFIYFGCYEALNRSARKFLDSVEKPKYIPFIPMVTATIAEAVSLVFLVPFDAMRTRMQSGSYNYPTVLEGFKEISRKEGTLRLFRASPVYLINALVTNTFLFQTYEYLRILLKERREKDEIEHGLLKKGQHDGFNLKETLIASWVSTTATAILTNPIDFIITRYQCHDASNKEFELSFKEVILKAQKEVGILGMNRGLVIKIIVTNILGFTSLVGYEYLRQNYGVDFSD